MQAEEYLGEQRQAPSLQTQLVLIASASPKRLMAGRKKSRNRALGEKKGYCKQIYSFPKQKGTILQLQLWWPHQLHPTPGACLVLGFKP